MKETEQQLSPTDQMLIWLEQASRNKPQWEMSKRFILNSKIWQDNLRQSGVDINRVRERIREIDFERREIRETYVEDDGLGRITRSRKIR